MFDDRLQTGFVAHRIVTVVLLLWKHATSGFPAYHLGRIFRERKALTGGYIYDSISDNRTEEASIAPSGIFTFRPPPPPPLIRKARSPRFFIAWPLRLTAQSSLHVAVACVLPIDQLLSSRRMRRHVCITNLKMGI